MVLLAVSPYHPDRTFYLHSGLLWQSKTAQFLAALSYSTHYECKIKSRCECTHQFNWKIGLLWFTEIFGFLGPYSKDPLKMFNRLFLFYINTVCTIAETRWLTFQITSILTAKEFAYCIHTCKQGGFFLNAVVVKQQNKFRRSTNATRRTWMHWKFCAKAKKPE